MKAVEYDKLPAKFRKQFSFEQVEHRSWLQKKYDGCFGMAILHEDGRTEMQSRTGEQVLSCDHILDELHEAKTEFIGTMGYVVLGEVWHPERGFPWISGKFRQHKPEPQLMFVANDLLPLGLQTTMPYESRFLDLNSMLPPMPNVSVTVAETKKKFTDAQAWARKWVAEGGYDGAILRDPWSEYTIGLVKGGELVKVKPTLSLDLSVCAITTATGEKTGRPVYTLLVRYKDVPTTVGSGVPHKSEDLPDVGAIVEIECLGLTEDGKLREPRYKGIRHDKEEQDT
jgi:DNA ligase-1